ncbi:LSU ribosomal protein L21p [Desulfovibrio sp. DV]|uniref:50S ribosomal protein L21 n=1 Tax=unclassified Desulfovibrio TaxID=2593640 RepID=UPI00057541B6|nr:MULTISPECIES: 50S ribosomal protein L21 [unclassified Desulfovibrio]KHK01592.1 LSU ribosomal protein L21p [Desulfovibrio sp. TomC]OLN24447.1 LSU ribosomal protein L21p [Desulfovibrio sp. DV]
MYAIVLAGGKQYKVQEGATITVDLVAADAGSEYVLDKVLMVGGTDVKVGAPYLSGAAVTCEVAGHVKGKKIVVFHKRRRKDSHKKQGHRQGYTQLTVKSIQV